MSDYRPITDTWMLTRARLKEDPAEPGVRQEFYGSYPGGFLGRARELLGVDINAAVLHVCGGKARLYPYEGFGPNDRTLDLDPKVKPDFLQDAREPFPLRKIVRIKDGKRFVKTVPWDAILMDPPYTEPDAEHYLPGAEKFPKPNTLMNNAHAVVKPGGCVGLLHYVLPALDKNKAKLVAVVSVLTGNNNRIRCYSVQRRK